MHSKVHVILELGTAPVAMSGYNLTEATVTHQALGDHNESIGQPTTTSMYLRSGVNLLPTPQEQQISVRLFLEQVRLFNWEDGSNTEYLTVSREKEDIPVFDVVQEAFPHSH